MNIYEMTSVSKRFKKDVKWSGYAGRKTGFKFWSWVINHAPRFVAEDMYHGLLSSRKVVEVL